MGGTGRLLRLLLTVLAFAVASPPEGDAQVWRRIVGAGQGVASAVTRLPGGDVVVAGRTAQSGGQVDGTVVRLDAATGALLWQRDFAGTLSFGYDEMVAVAADSASGVFVGGRVRNAGTEWDLTVAKLSAADGSVVWRREIDGAASDPNDSLSASPFDSGAAVAVDQAGNVVAGGRLVEVAGSPAFLTLVKLAGADGTTLWQQSFGSGIVRRVLIDAAGDVVVAGLLTPIGGPNRFLAMKLAGATGAELWRYESPGRAEAVALDASGDVLAAGTALIPPPPGSVVTDSVILVVKLAGSTGALVWRTAVPGEITPGNSGALDVTVDASGDAVAAGYLAVAGPQTAFAVVAFDGATGGELWRQLVRGCCTDAAVRVAMDPAGDVIAAGQVSELVQRGNLAAVKLAGSDGSVVWRRDVDGGANLYDQSEDLVLDAAGDPIVVGRLDDGLRPFSGFAAVKFANATGGDYLLAGDRLRVTDRGARGRRISVRTRARILPPPVPQAITDPSVGGATLQVLNPVSGEQATVALPAAGWRGIGSPAGSLGYRYADRSHAFGPCTKAFLRATSLIANCAGTGIAFTLDEASQGGLAVRVRQGSAGLGRCFHFGGSVRTDAPGTFTAVRAPAPDDCL